MANVSDLFSNVRCRLAKVMSSGEADAAARIIFEDVAGYDRNYLWVNGDRSVIPSIEQAILGVVNRVEQGTPVQYAVGKAMFMGNYFSVNEATLIPRPETAGLVDLITDSYASRSDLTVLDIGTGTGCIAIELEKALPFSRVVGWDISEKALQTATLNARNLHAAVTFVKQDALASSLPEATWDIIVSNPPYVLESEKSEMDANVLLHEPPTALFVPDADPFRFYKPISSYASKNLNQGGALFFEINQQFPEQVVALLQHDGFSNVEALRDYKGNWRFVRGFKQ